MSSTPAIGIDLVQLVTVPAADQAPAKARIGAVEKAEPEPPMFWFRDPDGNELLLVQPQHRRTAPCPRTSAGQGHPISLTQNRPCRQAERRTERQVRQAPRGCVYGSPVAKRHFCVRGCGGRPLGRKRIKRIEWGGSFQSRERFGGRRRTGCRPPPRPSRRCRLRADPPTLTGRRRVDRCGRR
jgi:hypothetical protein